MTSPHSRRDVLKAELPNLSAKKVTGLIMTQILPFADARAVKLYGQLESAVYGVVKAT